MEQVALLSFVCTCAFLFLSLLVLAVQLVFGLLSKNVNKTNVIKLLLVEMHLKFNRKERFYIFIRHQFFTSLLFLSLCCLVPFLPLYVEQRIKLLVYLSDCVVRNTNLATCVSAWKVLQHNSNITYDNSHKCNPAIRIIYF